jgi:rSAM/selenodomain-associated transferase 2
MKIPKLSIIIPVLNEQNNIKNTLTAILKNQNNEEIEIIVIDGGSTDNTISQVKNLGIEIYISPQIGRANQMNLGATKARGDILLFLHGDTIIPHNFARIIIDILAQSEVVGGAFSLKINGKKKAFKFIETMANWRSHLFSLPYGDQGIFLKRSIFEEIGGFKNLAIMEDFDLIQRLKKQGKISIASAKVITSQRRWQKLGILQTTLINQLIIIGYYMGISPEKLKQFYRRQKT